VLFNSFEFLIFFAVIAAAYMVAPSRARLPLLLAASLFFYGYTSPLLLLHLAAVAVATYYFAAAIHKYEDPRRKKILLTTALVGLVGNLVVFKYTSFLNETFRSLFGWFGAAYDIPVLNIILPLGISFYTFVLIGYLIDVYRGDEPERDWLVFGVFVFFFPKMIAGPIERGRNLLPQLRSSLPGFDHVMVTAGLQLMLWGAFKKVVVADRIAPFVDRVYDAPHEFSGVSLVFSTWLYAFQLYFDFSGYTDIALGAALVFGIRLLPNFNRPYFAVSIQDFWKRWHMSLTSWLNDYIYTPFMRSRFTGLKMYNLILLGMMLTFVVSGFWHGANWTFIVWGALHGFYIVVSLLAQKRWNKFAKKSGLVKRKKAYRALKISVTFVLVCFAYIFFRASNIGEAVYIVVHSFSGWGDVIGGVRAVVDGKLPEMLLALFGIAVVMAPELHKDHAKIGETYRALQRWQRWGLIYAATLSIVVLGAYYNTDQQFIYFRF
jgi:alginate O-acetyltransferase complex protein AlgI